MIGYAKDKLKKWNIWWNKQQCCLKKEGNAKTRPWGVLPPKPTATFYWNPPPAGHTRDCSLITDKAPDCAGRLPVSYHWGKQGMSVALGVLSLMGPLSKLQLWSSSMRLMQETETQRKNRDKGLWTLHNKGVRKCPSPCLDPVLNVNLPLSFCLLLGGFLNIWILCCLSHNKPQDWSIFILVCEPSYSETSGIACLVVYWSPSFYQGDFS